MFATLLGALPRPPLPEDATVEDLVAAAVRVQEAADLEPLTDGGQGDALPPLVAWSLTAALTRGHVKQAVVGPYSAARGWAALGAGSSPAADGAVAVGGHASPADARARSERTIALAGDLNRTLRALARAGCPLIEVHEPAAVAIGADATERALFRDAHRRLLDGVPATHLSLAITGGSADGAGLDTLLAAPYSSLAVDLIAGPDNWRLVVAAPGDRGVVCGALAATTRSDDGPEVLLWAAGYASASGSRGPDRVGLATASSLAALTWEAAVAKIEALGAALRIARLPPAERRAALDPRAVDARSAALGRYEPSPPQARRWKPPPGH